MGATVVTDIFLAWLPFYYTIKLIFVIWMLPKFQVIYGANNNLHTLTRM